MANLILGRNPALWVSAVSAIVNLLVALGAIHLSPEQLGAANAAIVAVIGLIANEADGGSRNLTPWGNGQKGGA